MSITGIEIFSQPRIWKQASAMVGAHGPALAAPTERMLVIGCGTSEYVGESFAAMRELAGFGETDARYASEPILPRRYDRVVALSRSGTTSEVLDALRSIPSSVHKVAVTAVAGTPIEDCVDECVVLDFADEASIVQTRYPTASLVLMRAALGQRVDHLEAMCEAALAADLPVDPVRADHHVFLGTGWTLGLAHEAALKVRETAQAYSESYPAMDYRHGPIAVAGPTSAVWFFGEPPAGLVDDVRATGACVVANELDPLVQLVLAQRFAVELAGHRGLDPDRPRHLSRSVIIEPVAAARSVT